jgi:hypothetical protein
MSLVLGYLIASTLDAKGGGGGGAKGKGGGGGGGPPNPWPDVPPGGWGPPPGTKGGGGTGTVAKPPGAKPPGAKPPGGTPIPPTVPGERVYLVQDGDTAVDVAKRFSGRVKNGAGPTASWTWKDLKFYDGGTIDTTTKLPVPWYKDLLIYLPDSWTVDLGPKYGAKGPVSTGARIHGDDLITGDVEGDEIAGETTDGLDTV